MTSCGHRMNIRMNEHKYISAYMPIVTEDIVCYTQEKTYDEHYKFICFIRFLIYRFQLTDEIA